MTRAAVNDAIWALSLVLQIGLLAIVFARGLARRMWLFTVLLAFYPLRSMLLFALARHLHADDYADLYHSLALAGLALLLAVEFQAALRLVRWRAALLLAAAGLALTALVVYTLPTNGPLPVDRVEVFGSAFAFLLAALLFAKSLRASAQPTAFPNVAFTRSITYGLGAFGAVDLTATTAKSHAAAMHQATAFSAWSYAVSLGYLLVVLYWMVALNDHLA